MKIKFQLAAPAFGLLGIFAFVSAIAADTQTLPKAFHEYGITKCDGFISENSPLESNWNVFISKHASGIDGPATEVTVTRIYGKKDDTVKVDDTYPPLPA